MAGQQAGSRSCYREGPTVPQPRWDVHAATQQVSRSSPASHRGGSSSSGSRQQCKPASAGVNSFPVL